jgi:hypothetical protein
MFDHKPKPKSKSKAAQQGPLAPAKSAKKQAQGQTMPGAAAGKSGGYAAQKGAVQPQPAAPMAKPAAPMAKPAPAAAASKAKPDQASAKKALQLPGSTLELLESTTLQVAKVASYQGAKSMPGAVASQLMEGVQREAVSDAKTLSAVLSEYIDGGEVDVYAISGPGQSLRWLRFWCGDTEVGYIFDGGKLVAIVGDQQINPV